MDKRYQVFVSSTYTDLINERREVMNTLLEIDCFPAGMELFPAADSSVWELIERVIRDSDFYVLIIGGRYGSSQAENPLSYTEREYDCAVASGIPVLAFLHAHPGSIPVDRSEINEEARAKLDAFKNKVSSRGHVKMWRDASDLRATVVTSVTQAKSRHDRPGWVRGDSVPATSVLIEADNAKREVARLQAELAAQRIVPPSDAVALQQGRDEFTLRGTYRADHSTGIPWEHTETWDGLFRLLAPRLRVPAFLYQIDQAIDTHITHCVKRRLENTSVSDVSVTPDSLNTVLVQLEALGLIAHIATTLKDQQVSSYQLTPYGERHLVQLLAVRKSAE